MFTVGFIPDGDNVGAVFRRENTGVQLRLRLLRKTIAHAEGKLAECESGLIHFSSGWRLAKPPPAARVFIPTAGKDCEIERAGSIGAPGPGHFIKEQTPPGDLLDPSPRIHGGCFGV
jgi:hypothetical protein